MKLRMNPSNNTKLNVMNVAEGSRSVVNQESDNVIVLDAIRNSPNGPWLMDKVNNGEMTIKQAAYEVLKAEKEADQLAQAIANAVNKRRGL